MVVADKCMRKVAAHFARKAREAFFVEKQILRWLDGISI